MDTHEISILYRQRPASMIDLTMGQWFCRAHNLDDKELETCQGVDATKTMLINKGYTNSSANVLAQYNRVNQEK